MMEGGMQNFDMTKIQDMMKEMTTMAKAIRDTNRQFARTVEPLLPADKQAKFDMEIKRRSFPKVYKEGYPAKAIAEAMKFNDLDASQKETIALLKEGYERDVETANKAWAAAIEEREEKNGGTMGAMMAMYTGGGDGKDAVGDARKARRELDGRVKDKLMTLLNEEQKKRLPEDKPDPKDNRMGMDFFNVDPPEQDD